MVTSATLLAVHGVRTPTAKGGWIETLLDRVTKDPRFASVDFEDGRYGFTLGFTAWLHVLRFWPGQQRRWVEYMKQRLLSIMHEHPGQPIDLIAHSYGTYLLYEAIRELPQVPIRTFVMIGAVVHTAETFEDTIGAGRIQTVINGCSRGDQIARWAPPPFGHSGYWGFRPKHHDTQGILTKPYPELPVFNLAPPDPHWRHGQYFSEEVDYIRCWLNLLVIAEHRPITSFDILEAENLLRQDLASPV